MTPQERERAIRLMRRRVGEPERAPVMPFADFIRESWPFVDPAEFVDGEHIRVIARILELVAHGERRNQLVNIPPRHMKSLLICVAFPAWVWTWWPSAKFMFSSYSAELATRDAVKTRRLIQSPWYQERWGKTFKLTTDQNVKTSYENDKFGHRFSVGVGGGATGQGADFIIADDPHKALEAESAVSREAVREWWSGTMSTRGNDPKTVRKIIVMQRLHEQDLTGEMLAAELGYEHLCLPARFESDHPFRCADDWRTEDGELLWPERFDDVSLSELEKQLGAYGVAGQLQQRPAPRTGGFFQTEQIGILDEMPADVVARVRFWDKAATTDGDWTVGVRMARTKSGLFIVEDVQRARLVTDKRDALILQTAQDDGKEIRVFAEEEPGSAGKDVSAYLARLLVGFSFEGVRATGAKEVRALPFASQVNAGNVRMLRAPWNRAYVDELRVFPAGRNDDQVDPSGGAFNKLAEPNTMQMKIGKFSPFA